MEWTIVMHQARDLTRREITKQQLTPAGVQVGGKVDADAEKGAVDGAVDRVGAGHLKEVSAIGVVRVGHHVGEEENAVVVAVALAFGKFKEIFVKRGGQIDTRRQILFRAMG